MQISSRAVLKIRPTYFIDMNFQKPKLQHQTEPCFKILNLNLDSIILRAQHSCFSVCCSKIQLLVRRNERVVLTLPNQHFSTWLSSLLINFTGKLHLPKIVHKYSLVLVNVTYKRSFIICLLMGKYQSSCNQLVAGCSYNGEDKTPTISNEEDRKRDIDCFHWSWGH